MYFYRFSYWKVTDLGVVEHKSVRGGWDRRTSSLRLVWVLSPSLSTLYVKAQSPTEPRVGQFPSSSYLACRRGPLILPRWHWDYKWASPSISHFSLGAVSPTQVSALAWQVVYPWAVSSAIFSPVFIFLFCIQSYNKIITSCTWSARYIYPSLVKGVTIILPEDQKSHPFCYSLSSVVWCQHTLTWILWCAYYELESTYVCF